MHNLQRTKFNIDSNIGNIDSNIGNIRALTVSVYSSYMKNTNYICSYMKNTNYVCKPGENWSKPKDTWQ